MVILSFLDPNVFNVMKYVIMSLTVSTVADLLLLEMQSYRTTAKLVKRGWVKPPQSFHIRSHRGIRFKSPTASIILSFSVIVIWLLEIALEFSTGATTIWELRHETFRMANQANNVPSLLNNSRNMILRMRSALDRVENLCYSTENLWYHHVTFNLTGSDVERGVGRAAKCFQNYSEPYYASGILHESGFRIGELVDQGIWNKTEFRIGRDVDGAEVAYPLIHTEAERVGPLEEYSFLAVSMSFEDSIQMSSVKNITAANKTGKKLHTFATAKFIITSGKSFDCLVRMDYDIRKPNLGWVLGDTDVCLIPISNGKTVLALGDDDENGGYQLVMSIAIEGLNEVFDLNALRMFPWMVGKNTGDHTYREIAILTTMCRFMVKGINISGYRDVSFDVAVRNVAVPTITLWGILLLVTSTAFIVILRSIIKRKRECFKIQGNLGTAKGIAFHWLSWSEKLHNIGNKNIDIENIVLVLESDEMSKDYEINVKHGYDFFTNTERRIESPSHQRRFQSINTERSNHVLESSISANS